MPQPKVNDFVIKFANVNGSGSASANQLFAKSILRMGVPVSPRNIFPSNIQGLPTWYEVRVSEAGYLGARGGVDLMVAMNPQTWDRDVLGIEPGGYLLYDSSKALPPSKFRDDINVVDENNQQVLAGYLARTYDVSLRDGFQEAEQRIESAIHSDVRQRIGGDTQRVHSISTDYGAMSYKHLLLPVWILAYKYGEKTYQVVVNAATGEVQGERPYSWIKITLFVLTIGVVATGIYLLVNR